MKKKEEEEEDGEDEEEEEEEMMVVLVVVVAVGKNKTNAQAIPPRRYGLQLHLCRISAI